MRLMTVEPVIFCYVFALVVLSPLLQQYIYEQLSESYNFTKSEDRELCDNDNVSEKTTKLEKLVQTQASHWLIGLSLSTCFPSVFATFMYGSMSDATGRKPVLLVTLSGAFIQCLLISITVTLDWPFYVIFLGSFVEGLTGSFATINGLCLAYIVDVTDDESRSVRLGILQICLVLSAMAGFLTSGIWLQHSGYIPPLWAVTSLLLLVIFYATFFIPESLKEKQAFNKFSCLANVKRIKDFVVAKRGPYVNICLVLLLISLLFSVFDYFGSITVLFTKHYPLCWGPELIGYYFAAKTATSGVGIMFTFKILTRCLTETMIVIFSCLAFILSNIIVGFAKTKAAMFFSCVPAFLAFSAPPCIRSIATKLVEKHEEGTLCCLLAVTESLAQLVSPVAMNMLYTVGLNTLDVPGFAFFVEAGLLSIPITLFFIIHHLTHRSGHIKHSKLPEISEENNVQVST